MRHKSILLVLTMTSVCSLQAFAASTSKEELIYQQVDAVVKNYQQAHVLYADGDNSKALLMTQALEDLEDLANQCFKLKKCSKTKIISAYEQIIKSKDIANISAIDPANVALIPALGSTIELLGSKNFEMLIQYNEPVQAAISNWLSTQRSFFIESWVNYQYMRYLMAPEYEKAGLPEALLFGMLVKESGGKVHSTSKAGATGPLQFMPSTGTRFGLGFANGYDMRYDPQYAARANAAYMNERFRELNNSLEMAIAGYNGGEGRARRISKDQNGASFWTEDVYKQWPAETRDYVPAVLAAAWLFLHGEDYGLTFPKLDVTPSQFTLERASSINQLTICLGNPNNQNTWFRVIRNLNPAYEPGQYIEQGAVLRAPKKLVDSYQANCVSGARAEMARKLVISNKTPNFEAIEATTQANENTGINNKIEYSADKNIADHKVKLGETLMSISRKYECLLPDLIEANNLSPPKYEIRPKQIIKLAGCKK